MVLCPLILFTGDKIYSLMEVMPSQGGLEQGKIAFCLEKMKAQYWRLVCFVEGHVCVSIRHVPERIVSISMCAGILSLVSADLGMHVKEITVFSMMKTDSLFPY